MEIIRWSPFREFAEVRREMDQLVNEFFGKRTPLVRKEKRFPLSEGYFLPLDIYEKGENIVIKAGIPGVKKEDIHIDFMGDSLTIKGEIRGDSEVKDENYYHVEQLYGSFSRSITLPIEVDPRGMAAHYKDGILEIILPKLKNSELREIKVEVL